jgi:putative ABC transport system substrate-binding protein
MWRREFITLVGGAAVVWPITVHGQRAERVATVGVLSSGTAARAQEGVGELIQALGTLGHFQGKNIKYVVRFSEGQITLLPSLAAELVAQNVDVIVASTTPAIRAAQEATRIIPIVMVNTADPVRLGFVQNLARPGGNITGLSNQVADLGSKQLQLLKEIVPNAQRIGILINPRNPSHALAGLSQSGRAARSESGSIRGCR